VETKPVALARETVGLPFGEAAAPVPQALTSKPIATIQSSGGTRLCLFD
jgi:hypothetical protein